MTASQQPVGETEIVETPAELVGDDPQQTVDNSTAASIVNATSPTSNRTVLVDLRINFVQSIRQLTSVLDSDSPESGTSIVDTNTLLSAKLDLRLSAYSQTLLPSENVQGLVVDAEA